MVTQLRQAAIKNPVQVFLSILLPFSWITLTTIMVNHLPPEPGVLALTFLGLVGLSALITYWKEKKPGIQRLFSGLTKWRVGVGYYLFALFTVPLMTLFVSKMMGTFQSPAEGWETVFTTFAISLLSGALIINLWEETGWTGFVQARLMKKYGLLKGSLLTAPAFAAIHIPLAFQQPGLTEVLVTIGILFGLAFFFRYLIGVVFEETKGSLLIVGLLHASFNSSNSLGPVKGQTEVIVATILLTLLVAAYRATKKRSLHPSV